MTARSSNTECSLGQGLSQLTQQHHKVRTVSSPIVQRRTLRLREVMSLAYGPRTGKKTNSLFKLRST